LSGEIAHRRDEMNTQQMSDDVVRQTDLAGGRRLDSMLRTITVAVALLTFGISAPMVFADHMGNHERGSAESAGCGKEASETEAADAQEQSSLTYGRPR
jgi:hypothetical protein